MTESVFTIPNFTSLAEARDLLAEEASKRCALQTNKVELGKLFNGLSLRLHNKGIRPTVYSVEIITDPHGKVSRLVIDTIIAENKDHETLKTSFSHGQASHIINLLVRLSKQPCNGDAEDTNANFIPLGLLYSKRTNEEKSE